MPAPDGLKAPGVRLWEALGFELDSPSGVLALEACRIADRLEELDLIIAGKGVLELMKFRVGDIFSGDDEQRVSVQVRFDSVLGEARQQQNTLRQMVSTLAAVEGASAAPPAPAAKPPASAVDEFTAARHARRGGA